MSEFVGCWKKYAVFAGRARRREYWMFVLFNFIVAFVIGFVLGLVGGILRAPALGSLSHLYTLAALLPGLSVAVRRLHDIGKSGWWLLVSLIPLVGWIVLIIFYCRDSQPGANAYGPDPKGSMVA